MRHRRMSDHVDAAKPSGNYRPLLGRLSSDRQLSVVIYEQSSFHNKGIQTADLNGNV